MIVFLDIQRVVKYYFAFEIQTNKSSKMFEKILQFSGQRRKAMLVLFFTVAFVGHAFSVILPNPKISDGKTVFTSKGNAAYLVDNKFNASSWSAANNSWIAIPVDSGPSKIFFNWNNPSYAWSNELSPSQCPNSNAFPVDYNLLVSSNSTNGLDGDWTIADSIRNNIVCARGHLINFVGAKWLKMEIIKGGGRIDEIQVYDASDSNEDVWFFVGTSISANTFKGTPPAVNYADIVTEKHPDYNPVMIRGGIGCISSTDFAKNLSNYLKMAGNAHFWAIEMGTNDAWGGSNGNVATFKRNLQLVIDSCKVYGIQPIIARVLATNETAAAWQVNPDFLKAVDDLTASNGLVPGPDLYTWFLAHPAELNSDGVHPSAAGAASIQRLWAEKMDSLYGGCPSTPIVPFVQVNGGGKELRASISIYTRDTVVVSPTAGTDGSWVWSGPNDFTATSREISLSNIQPIQSGNYVVTYTNSNSCSSSYTINIAATNRVAIDMNDLAATIQLYPNPSNSGQFTLEVDDINSSSHVQIIDLQGRMVYQSNLSQKKTVIDPILSKGTYIVKVADVRSSFNQKLIIE